jgi:O2-independent ubiquinone biosynthesis accessory factor UbiT
VFPALNNPPPFSPVLVAGILVRPLPITVIQSILDAAFQRILRHHNGLFERLDCLENPVFLIDPVDLPFVFVLDANVEQPRLQVCSETHGQETATIRGPLLILIKLLEGRVDGDAMFFSRDLLIEGDTEAVVALRNAIDDADIDIANDIISSLGPFARPANFAHRFASRFYNRLEGDLALLHAAISSARQNGPLQ